MDEEQNVETLQGEGGDVISDREQMCTAFASIAGCDQGVAQCYLAENDWELERAINSYFEPGVESISQEGNTNQERQEGIQSEQTVSEGQQMPVTAPDCCIDLTSDEPVISHTAKNTAVSQKDESHFIFVTWNIDGLDFSNLPERARAVCSYLALYSPDVVFLQEVIPPLYDYLKKRAVSYTIITGNDNEYFTAIMLKKSRATLVSQEIIPFPTTSMMRNLLVAHVGKIGGLPSPILDIWEFLGKPEHCRYTWDTKMNNNIKASYTCRMRFDRILYRSAVDGIQVIPHSLELIGTEKLDCGRFPSDHWGLLCDFDVIL
ncbi:tyrosyl-DNA phosphodiesterase 2 isoform X2 [Aquarana catesbeiana]|uniref:tyrosyl-DNA phosphodiesterase 2 isoform X2 n=1 Tax=Aquarana catesbeiana TaxID=8400 RepID=UPI003CC9A478